MAQTCLPFHHVIPVQQPVKLKRNKKMSSTIQESEALKVENYGNDLSS